MEEHTKTVNLLKVLRSRYSAVCMLYDFYIFSKLYPLNSNSLTGSIFQCSTYSNAITEDLDSSTQILNSDKQAKLSS